VFSRACNEFTEHLCARCARAKVHRRESVVIGGMATRAVWSKKAPEQTELDIPTNERKRRESENVDFLQTTSVNPRFALSERR
jgi:hypothetical protein